MLSPSDKIEVGGMAAGWAAYYCSHLVSLLCQGLYSTAAFAWHMAMPSSDSHLPAHLPCWAAEPWPFSSPDMVVELGKECLLLRCLPL